MSSDGDGWIFITDESSKFTQIRCILSKCTQFEHTGKQGFFVVVIVFFFLFCFVFFATLAQAQATDGQKMGQIFKVKYYMCGFQIYGASYKLIQLK